MRHANAVWVSALAALTAAIPGRAAGQSPSVVAHTVDVSRDRATLELELSNDSQISISLDDGALTINGNPAGTYAPGGPLDKSWRAFLDSAASLNSAEVLRAAKQWTGRGAGGADSPAAVAIGKALGALVALPPIPVVAAPVPPPAVPEPEFAVPAFPDQGFGFERRVERSSYAGVLPTVAGLLGAFVALASMAFGLISFAPRQLEIVAGTVRNSFVRSFFAGLFAQPLLLPALGVLCVALVLTVVGILVIPVAIIAFAVAVAAGVVGGYIAAARALGEGYLRRRMERGGAVSADPAYRSILVGLAGLLMIWAPFALLGWLPGVGFALLCAAVIFTWIIATAGLGATILSRAGIRRSFGREPAKVSGELSWSSVEEIAPSRRGEGSIP